MESLTFVTPVFEAETALLGIQARSFARHLDAAALRHHVLVLDNTARGLTPAARSALLSEYGPWTVQVRILRPNDVCALPRASGWRSQQILKLMVARLVETPHYVALDAKNHLVAALPDDFFFGPDGRTRVRAYGYTDHPLRPALERVLTYLDLEPREHVQHFAATVTPFVLDTGVVRELVADVERSAGRPFAEEFVRAELTEFFLYAGWLVRRDGDLGQVMDLTDSANPVVWPRAATLEGVQELVESVDRNGAPFFGVHRNAVPVLTQPARSALAEFWVQRELVDSPAAGVRLLESMSRDYDRLRRRQLWRDLRPRAAVATRRVRTRLLRRTR